jgi:hypothetical protein
VSWFEGKTLQSKMLSGGGGFSDRRTGVETFCDSW